MLLLWSVNSYKKRLSVLPAPLRREHGGGDNDHERGANRDAAGEAGEKDRDVVHAVLIRAHRSKALRPAAGSFRVRCRIGLRPNSNMSRTGQRVVRGGARAGVSGCPLFRLDEWRPVREPPFISPRRAGHPTPRSE